MTRCWRNVHVAAAALTAWVLMTSGQAALAQTVIDPTLEVTIWATGVLRPTSFAILPQGPGVNMLVCEKETGKVIYLSDGVIQGTALDVAVNYNSERGMLGIALHPDFANNGYVYVYYTPSSTGFDTNVAGDLLAHRVERYTWNGATLGAVQPILTLPSAGGPNHDGGVLRFGPDGMLYGVIGDLNRNGQLENFPNGPIPDSTAIIYRVTADGSAPGDNPFAAIAGMQIVYAYGVRNSFGLEFDPLTGDLWDTENGPNSYDEINRVLPGMNSGWEQIMGPDDRDPAGVGDLWMAPGAAYSDPEFSWLQTIGVTSIRFLRDGVLGAAHDGACLVGDNNTGSLYRFEPDAGRTSLVMPTIETSDRVADTVAERNTFQFGSGFGVVTGIEIGPDAVYVTSHLANRIYRIASTATDTGSVASRPRLRVLPNPGSGRTLVQLSGGRPATLEAHIYTPAGRLVRALRGSGTEIDWDGRDAAGQPLAAGVYLLQLDAGMLSLRSKIIRVR